MSSPLGRGRGGFARFLSAPPIQQNISSLLHLSLCAVCSPFFLGDFTDAHQKKELNRILRKIVNAKGLKAKFFSQLLEQCCYEGSVLSTFSSAKGGFLTSLDLSATKVTNRGLALVGTVKTLTTLVLRSCGNFDDGGLSSLVRGGCASRLKVLDLSKCRKITDPGLSHLLSLSQLRTLDLSDLLITNEGVAELRGLTKLQHLSLSRTKITDEAIEVFAKDFELEAKRLKGSRKGLLSLETLKLCSLGLSAQIVLLLSRFPSLALVDLFGCWPSEDIWDKFQGELVQHRGDSAKVHRTTGKLIITVGEEEKVDVERENSWKLVCPSQPEWNTRRLVTLLNGSDGTPPSPGTPPAERCRRQFHSPSVRFSSPLCGSPERGGMQTPTSAPRFSSPLLSSPMGGRTMPSSAILFPHRQSSPNHFRFFQPRAFTPATDSPEQDEDEQEDSALPIPRAPEPRTKEPTALNRLCLLPRAASAKKNGDDKSEDKISSDDEMTEEDLLPLSSLKKNKENDSKPNLPRGTPVLLKEKKTTTGYKLVPTQTRKRRKLSPEDSSEAGLQNIMKPKPKITASPRPPPQTTKGKGSRKPSQKSIPKETQKGKKAQKSANKQANEKTKKPAHNPEPKPGPRKKTLPKPSKSTKANTSSPPKEMKGKASMKIYQKNSGRKAKRAKTENKKEEEEEMERALHRSEVEKERAKRIQSYREMRKFCADSELSRKRKRSCIAQEED